MQPTCTRRSWRSGLLIYPLARRPHIAVHWIYSIWQNGFMESPQNISVQLHDQPAEIGVVGYFDFNKM
jgi:hypothetical protein